MNIVVMKESCMAWKMKTYKYNNEEMKAEGLMETIEDG